VYTLKKPTVVFWVVDPRRLLSGSSLGPSHIVTFTGVLVMNWGLIQRRTSFTVVSSGTKVCPVRLPG